MNRTLAFMAVLTAFSAAFSQGITQPGGGSSGGSIAAGGSVTGLIDINNNLAPGFRVEQDGVYNDLFRVNTSTGRVNFGLNTDQWADDGSTPALTSFYTRVRCFPWRTQTYGGGQPGKPILNGMFDIDCRSTNTVGDRPFRFFSPSGFGLSNAASIYIDSGASMWMGSSLTIGARNNETNDEDNWAFLPAIYEPGGAGHTIPYMLGIHSDVGGPGVIINNGPAANLGYPLAIGYSDSVNANTDLTHDIVTFAMERDGAMYWSGGTGITAGQLPEDNSNFDVTLSRTSSGKLTVAGDLQVTGVLTGTRANYVFGGSGIAVTGTSSSNQFLSTPFGVCGTSPLRGWKMPHAGSVTAVIVTMSTSAFTTDDTDAPGVDIYKGTSTTSSLIGVVRVTSKFTANNQTKSVSSLYDRGTYTFTTGDTLQAYLNISNNASATGCAENTIPCGLVGTLGPINITMEVTYDD